MEELFAVWASFVSETLFSTRLAGRARAILASNNTYCIGHNYGANHTGAQVALLAWCDEVLGHDCACSRVDRSRGCREAKQQKE